MYPQWTKSFAMIFGGQLISILTSSMVQFSILWHLTTTSGSAAVLMLAGLSAFLPQALLGPFVGVWLDRWNRKKTMIIADSVIAFFSLLLGAYFFWAEPSLAFTYAILMLRSAASAFHAPAFQAAIPLIAPEDQLTRVAGWHQMVFSCASVFGPALGITVYAASSLGTVLFLDVAGALFANFMLMLVTIEQPKPSSVQTPSFVTEFKLGWSAFVTVKPLVAITFATTIFGIAFMPLATLFPLMTFAHFGRGGYSASMVESVFGGGMIVGGALLSVFASKWKDTTYMSVSLVTIGLACVGSGTLGQEAFAVFVLLSFLMGAAGPLFNGPYIAMIQRLYEPEKLGRVLSLVTSITLLTSPIGLALAGPIVDHYGVQTWFFGSGIVIVCTGIFIYTKCNQLNMK